MTRSPEDGNGCPLGGLWAWVGHNPLSALGTGREGGQDLRDPLGLLNDGEDPYGAATPGTHEGVHLVDLLDQPSPGTLRHGGGYVDGFPDGRRVPHCAFRGLPRLTLLYQL
jgi:hypothetical protein